MGTAPASTTTLVCSEVPDATLVSAQAASNCGAQQKAGGQGVSGCEYSASGQRQDYWDRES
jgi:hypothetical protein